MDPQNVTTTTPSHREKAWVVMLAAVVLLAAVIAPSFLIDHSMRSSQCVPNATQTGCYR